MHLDRPGITDRLAGEPRDPGPPCQMLALALRPVPLARMRRGRSEMPWIRAPRIRVRAPEATSSPPVLSRGDRAHDAAYPRSAL